MEVKNIIISNPGNKDLRDNLLPLWISNELSISEAIDILNTVDGKIETATILHEANKIVTLFNKPIINGYKSKYKLKHTNRTSVRVICSTVVVMAMMTQLQLKIKLIIGKK